MAEQRPEGVSQTGSWEQSWVRWHTRSHGDSILLKAAAGPANATPTPAHTLRVWEAGADARHHPPFVDR